MIDEMLDHFIGNATASGAAAMAAITTDAIRNQEIHRYMVWLIWIRLSVYLFDCWMAG